MKKIFLPLLICLVLQAPPVTAGEILVVQSLSIRPYNEALQGFKSVCGETTSRLISSEMSEAAIIDKVRRDKPDLVLAIGMDALLKVKTVKEVPIIYLMVLNPGSLLHSNDNITGIDMAVRPELQLAAFHQIFPQAGRILVPYDPGKSGTFVRTAQSAAGALGFELLARKVSSPREAVAVLDTTKGKIDALWLLPDTTVVTPGTIDLLLLSAIERKIPVLTFSDKYAEKGALLSLEVDNREAGKQAGDMARRILAGTAVKNIERSYARGMTSTINLIVAKKLGISVAGSLIRQSRVIK